MSEKPEVTLLKGAELLKPLFAAHGFHFVQSHTGESSGGRFASAEFRKADRRFEFHFRFSLGMVSYHLGSESISHEEYMYSVLGETGVSQYPGFSLEPLDAFRHLRDDLQNHCGEFFEGTDDSFLRRIQDARTRWANRPKLPD